MFVKNRVQTLCGILIAGTMVISANSNAQDSTEQESRKALQSNMDVVNFRVNSRETKIEQALLMPAQFDFFEMRFEDIMAELASDFKIQVALSNSAAKIGNLDKETLITLRIQQVSLRSALQVMLNSFGCTVIVKDEVLYVTTKDEANNFWFVRVYDCRALAEKIEGDQEANFEKLINVLRVTVNSKSWESNGGSGGIGEIGGRLVISQNGDGHRKIAAILNSLNEQFDDASVDDGPEELAEASN